MKEDAWARIRFKIGILFLPGAEARASEVLPISQDISTSNVEFSWYNIGVEISRTKELTVLQQRLKDNPVVAILGPRQCGKTTLSKQFARTLPVNQIHFFDLEDPRDIARLDNPTLAFEPLEGIVVIDEIQRKPDLFPVLRVLVDQRPQIKYLILGSASRDLVARSSESLAGRISYMEMGGFALSHLSPKEMKKLWIRGGFPRSFLANTEQASYQWRQDFITTFLERDIPNLGFSIPARMLRRFWTMLAHYHGQLFNASEIGRSLAVADNTARRYLDLLCGTFLVRQLQPWYYNTKKRLVKRPKIYFRDSGILHALLALEGNQDVLTHPKLGASWEGFALEQAIEFLNLREAEAFFWAVHTGAELDLVFVKKGKMWGIEAKYDEAPKLTKSMHMALEELALEHLWVLYPGGEDYSLSKKISVVSLKHLSSLKCV